MGDSVRVSGGPRYRMASASSPEASLVYACRSSAVDETLGGSLAVGIALISAIVCASRKLHSGDCSSAFNQVRITGPAVAGIGQVFARCTTFALQSASMYPVKGTTVASVFGYALSNFKRSG